MATTKFNEQQKAWENGNVMINGVYLHFCEMGKDVPMYWKIIKRSYKKANETFFKICNRDGAQLIQMYFDEDEKMWKNIVPKDTKWLKYNANNYLYIVGYNN